MRWWLVPLLIVLAAGIGLAGGEVYEHRGALYEGRGHMHRVLTIIDLPFIDAQWTITGWKILGFAGALCFASRWLVQAWHRRKTGSAAMPTAFWVISLLGAGLVTMYFIWGKNDSVGILTNALPAAVAFWNLVQDLRGRLRGGPAPG
ncbi:MAG: lipid-A-disaccharide synthase N-terminal domain-containing protein [Planctomycetota bacterium]|nr:lipid-A-disaccharide synthase N-terminal domain-containing protein [Planctomycetota bacterium]MCX8039621.1 lipid-A-disaccharide synthase N-terminal domain-containing protein [Planctomycetota bacterium]MDW8373084.1 lipid-A-disaccharide synthase N-terminal domain-containing protein [Planctomycetota bacterium]